MRISKEDKIAIRQGGLNGLFKFFSDEMVVRIGSLKKATDMNAVSRLQGAIEILEALDTLDKSRR